MKSLINLVMVIGWIVGVVISSGFWACLFAIFVVPYAWYLVIEKIMVINGWL